MAASFEMLTNARTERDAAIKRAIDAEKRANKTENLLAAVGGSDGGDTAGGYGGGGDAAASTRGSDSQASNIGEDNGSADASNGTGISSSSMWSSASTITFLIALSSFLCLCNLATWCYCLRSRGCGNNDRRKKLESENETKPCLVGSTESVNPLQLPKDSPGVVETRRMLTPSIHKNKGRMMVAAKRKSRRQSIKKEFGQVQMSSRQTGATRHSSGNLRFTTWDCHQPGQSPTKRATARTSQTSMTDRGVSA